MSAADSEVREGFAPGRLWSLWDMLEFRAGNFFDLTQKLLGLQRYCQDRAEAEKRSSEVKEFDAVGLKLLTEKCAEMRELCVAIGADCTLASVDNLSVELVTSWYLTHSSIAKHIETIQGRLKDELGASKFYSLNREEKNLYEQSSKFFGSDFETKFKTDAQFELDEALKCLALSRSTASVFHLMRLSEIGLRALARCLSIPDPMKPHERNWTAALSKIKTAIDAKWPNSSDRMSGDGRFFEGLYASLDAMKNPWRNGTMHLDGKQTTQEAEDILYAIRGFMRRLASRCDEEGLPLALPARVS